MADHDEIPAHLRETYRRMVFRAPEKLRIDSSFQQMTLLHLKVGGERLASQNTELFKLRLEEERIFNRWLIRESGSDENEVSDADELSAGDDAADQEDEDDTSEDDLDDEEDYPEEDAEDDDFSDGPAMHA